MVETATPLTTDEKIRLLRDAFVARDDVFAIQFQNADGDWRFARVKNGRCPTPFDCPKATCPHVTSVPLTDRWLVKHLRGDETIGIYQLDDEDRVKWIALDVDINGKCLLPPEEAKALVQRHARDLARAFQKERVPFLMEGSGSKGWHLWVFFAEKIPARTARAIGFYLDGLVQPPEGIHVEVFPKQSGLTRGPFGNLVKLPLGVHRKSGARCLFVDGSFAPLEDRWSGLVRVRRLTAAQADAFVAARNLTLPEEARIANGLTGGVGALTPPCMVNIRDGVGDGARDTVAFRYACYWRDRGARPQGAMELMREWNGNNAPPLSDDELRAKVESAFSGGYSYFPCNEPLFDPYCSETCTFYAKKMAGRNRNRSWILTSTN